MNAAGWPMVTLGQYLKVVAGPAFKSADFSEDNEDVRLLRGDNVAQGTLRWEGARRWSSEVAVQFHLQLDDVVIAMDRPWIDAGLKWAWVKSSDLPSYLVQRVARLRASQGLDQKFLRYVVASPDFTAYIRPIVTGATVPHISGGQIEAHRFPLPPLLTQRKIAAILSAYDDLIENNTRRVQVLEQMARDLYREWFVEFRFPGHETAAFVEDEHGRRPEGWMRGRLDDCLVLQRGFDLPTRQRVDGSYPIFASTGVNGHHNEMKVSGPGVVTGRSGSLGTVMLVLEDFWPLNTTLWVKEFKHAQPVYAYYLLSSLDLAQYNAGAAVPTLNRNDIHGLPVLLPSQVLLQSFETFVMTLHQQIEALLKRNANLRRTRDLLLPKLVSGDLDVSALDVRGPGLKPVEKLEPAGVA